MRPEGPSRPEGPNRLEGPRSPEFPSRLEEVRRSGGPSKPREGKDRWADGRSIIELLPPGKKKIIYISFF